MTDRPKRVKVDVRESEPKEGWKPRVLDDRRPRSLSLDIKFDVEPKDDDHPPR